MAKHCLFPFFTMVVFVAAMLLGCSGPGGSPVVAPQTPPAQQPSGDIPKSGNDASGARMLCGLWQFEVDPQSVTLRVTLLREALMHLNALPFLEPPPLYYLTLESPIEFNGNLANVDIGLRHPFPGLTEFTGFDVRKSFFWRDSVSSTKIIEHIQKHSFQELFNFLICPLPILLNTREKEVR